MESYLDLPNTMYSDYLQGWTLDAVEDSDYEEYAPKVVASIDHYGSSMSVYGRDAVAPSLNSANGTEGSIHFLVPTADMGLKQSVRPVRDHELFALYGSLLSLRRLWWIYLDERRICFCCGPCPNTRSSG
jgi:hypothetical protein